MESNEGNDMTNRNAAIVAEYKAKHGDFVAFTEELKRLLKGLIDAEEFGVHLVEGRAKDPKSLEEKLCRPGKATRQNLNEISDLSGLRIIAYYTDDIEYLTEIIRREFDIVEEESSDKGDELKPDQFGYRSRHFVVRLKQDRTNLPEWRRFAGFKAEIQVRTVLQHAWAAVSHALSYKKETDVPTELRRKLNRLAGLFELADEQFVELRIEQEQINSASEESIDDDDYDVEITPDTLASYVDHSGIDGECQTLASSFAAEVIPFCQSSRSTDYSDLAEVCKICGLTTIAEFDGFIRAMIDSGIGIRNLQALGEKSPSGWTVSPLFVMQLLILLDRGGNLESGDFAGHTGSDPESLEVVLEVARHLSS